MKIFEIENFEEFHAFAEKTLLEITNSSQLSIYFINSSKKLLIKARTPLIFEEFPIEIGIIGEVYRISEEIFAINGQNHVKFNQKVDFLSNLPVHTYPMKGNNGVFAVIQFLKFHDMLGRKMKKDVNEEEVLTILLASLAKGYESKREEMKFLE